PLHGLQRQFDRFAFDARAIRGKDDLVRFVRIGNAGVAFFFLLDALDQVLYLIDEGVMRHVAAVGEDGRDDGPTGLPRKFFFRVDLVVSDRAAGTDEVDVEDVRLDALDTRGDFANPSVLDFHDGDAGGVVLIVFKLGRLAEGAVLGDFLDLASHKPAEGVHGMAPGAQKRTRANVLFHVPSVLPVPWSDAVVIVDFAEEHRADRAVA